MIVRGDIYYIDLSPVKGSEQGGKRPCLILQNDVGNRHAPTTIVAVITSKGNRKHQIPTHHDLNNDFFPYPSTVLLEQLRTVDKTRLGEYMGTLTTKQMAEIEKKLKISLGMA